MRKILQIVVDDNDTFHKTVALIKFESVDIIRCKMMATDLKFVNKMILTSSYDIAKILHDEIDNMHVCFININNDTRHSVTETYDTVGDFFLEL